MHHQPHANPSPSPHMVPAKTVVTIALCVVFVAALLLLLWYQDRIRTTVKRRTGPTEIANLRSTISTFEVDNGRVPTTAEGLDALLTCPPGLAPSWRGPYLEKLPLDPSGHPYLYRSPGQDAEYDLLSPGPDDTPVN